MNWNPSWGPQWNYPPMMPPVYSPMPQGSPTIDDLEKAIRFHQGMKKAFEDEAKEKKAKEGEGDKNKKKGKDKLPTFTFIETVGLLMFLGPIAAIVQSQLLTMALHQLKTALQ